MGQSRKRKRPVAKAKTPAKKAKTTTKTSTTAKKRTPAKTKKAPATTAKTSAKAKGKSKPSKKATAKNAKTVATPAPAPVPAPAAAPPIPAATPVKEKKPKEMSDEIKKLFRSLAAKASTGTQKVLASDLDDCTVNDLKIALKLNDRSTTGNRTDLVSSVCDNINNGCPPRCPDCGGGRLRYKSGKYWCPGYMEDDEFINCSFKAGDGDVTRISWKSP